MTPWVLFSVMVSALMAALLIAQFFPRAWLVAHLVGTGSGLGFALGGIGGRDWAWRIPFAMGGEYPHLQLDALSALFLVLISVVGAAGGIFAHGYWSGSEHPKSAGSGRFWWSGLVLSMSLLLLCQNGLHFLIGWEVFALCAYFLITLDRKNPETRRAGWLYLAASHAGTMLLFFFFGGLAARTGSWELGPMRDQPALAPLFWLAMFGFGVKAGLFPLHIWLPSAHANSPSHVSAIMSGVAVKMGVFGIVRFGGWLPVTTEQALTLLALGVAGAVLGIAFALAQNDFKRLLAYCSVENVGVILIGIAVGLLGAATGHANWGRLAVAGALLHVWNHGLFKSLLFFGAGSVLHATGTREMSRLGGLWRAMPWTASLFVMGSVAISSLPPLNGFVSEWLIYLGLFDAGMSHQPSTWAALPAVMGLAVAGALALACFIKLCSMVFLGAPRTSATWHAHECGWWMRAPMLGLAGCCVFIGLTPVTVWPLIQNALVAWQPCGELAPVVPPVLALGRMQMALAIALGCAVLFVFIRLRGGRIQRRLTWDCGYAEPSSRMQYTSGSFGELGAGWFRWILRPVVQGQRPKGLFPLGAHRSERTPETVLEGVIEPSSRGLLWLAWQTRRLQHGRLQAYILYLVVGLIVLALITVNTVAP